MIQSENTFLVGYVIFDKLAGKAEVDIVKEASRILEQQIKEGELNLIPAYPISSPAITSSRSVPPAG